MNAEAQLKACEALLKQLDVETDMGTLAKKGAVMKKQGIALQALAQKIKSQSDSEQARADLFNLRGLAYEGEGLMNEPFGAAKGLAAMIPNRFMTLAARLADLDFMGMDDVSAAHGVKVQAMVALGRFYFRLPRPVKNLDKADTWLSESIKESPRNPVLKDPIHPVLPRLYLIDVLHEQESDPERIETLLEEVDGLLKKPLSVYEEHVEDFLQRYFADLSSR